MVTLTLHVGVSTNLFVDLPAKLLEELVGKPGDKTLGHANNDHDHNQERCDGCEEFLSLARSKEVMLDRSFVWWEERRPNLTDFKNGVGEAAKVESNNSNDLDCILSTHLKRIKKDIGFPHVFSIHIYTF